nr:MAG TPA: hypothetical protein [Caudoviricetes sp.]
MAILKFQYFLVGTHCTYNLFCKTLIALFVVI